MHTYNEMKQRFIDHLAETGYRNGKVEVTENG